MKMAKPFFNETLYRVKLKRFDEEEGWAVVCFLASCLHSCRENGTPLWPFVIDMFTSVVWYNINLESFLIKS